ncbi:MAG: tRNA epoxyqueuosine(34) reductase QueG [Acidobacteria bacterium]|nr:tRNA epoxyqueuosine(34) reductase QueG [Acidobacteriota bacterium]
MNLTARIKQRAIELGFDRVGMVAADKLGGENTHLRAWLDRGFAGTMEWIERSFEKRIDPSAHMPDVCSIVCVAMNYYTSPRVEDLEGHGKISRYAWGDDYHQVLGERLRRLLDWICSQEPRCRGKIAVDSSPIMDKVWAARAGLGWMGKHSNLIHPTLGSWIFLGELLLSLELEYEEAPVADRCGNCTLCIDSCPTSAIVEPYVVDSRKCISYQTIEFRGDELQVDTHGWIFGCDVCQDVCPWNRSAQESKEERFQPRPGLANPSVDQFCQMREEEFRQMSKRSAIRRAKYQGMIRNARHARARKMNASSVAYESPGHRSTCGSINRG